MISIGARKEKILFRMVVPAYPRPNIFSEIAKGMTALGPVMVATIASQISDIEVQIIDENNYNGPKDKRGLPDHSALQKEKPADVVGFYCGMSCTIERVWELAEFYQKQDALTIAGGWHAKDCMEETLNHNIDIIFYANEEEAIREFFLALAKDRTFKHAPGLAYLEQGKLKKNPCMRAEVIRGYDPSLDKSPFPNYGLLAHSNGIRIFTIRRIAGCSERCEFCRVKAIPRWASPEYLLETVRYLVYAHNARYFFIADDNSGEDREGGLKFFRMVKQAFGNTLKFYVQVRADLAEDLELTEAMAEAGVEGLCIGYESPINEDLEAMGKGFRFADMVNWTRILRRKFHRLHGMFIVGYPSKQGEIRVSLSVEKIVQRFKQFISKSGLTSIQVLLPIPLSKTGLKARLEREGKILPMEIAPHNCYDGTLAVIIPDDMSFEEFQEIPIKIMKWFYSPWSYFRIILRFCDIPAALAGRWKKGLFGESLRCLGSRIIKRWQKRGDKEALIQRFRAYLKRKGAS